MNDAGETAYAKINLALHVRRREADGYHAIETLFAFCEDGDRLDLAEEPGLAVTGPFAAALADGAGNLVTRAARGFAAVFGTAERGFQLDKRLPVASGIGGGSADAAAALRLLARVECVAGADRRLVELAATLGADVPACLASRAARGEGRGDRLTPLTGLPPAIPVLLVNPMTPLSTARVFAAWDGRDRGPLADGDAWEAMLTGRNDLEPPARAIRPEIGAVLAMLTEQPGVRVARMSGSGATCFAVFADISARDAAVAAVRRARPEWWLLASRLR